MNTEKLVNTASLSSRAISAKRNSFEVKTVKREKQEELQEAGWEIVPSKLKSSVRIKKPKKHNVAFEERVWALFAQMGFTYLNADASYTLEYADGLTKQIDVFAVAPEAVLIVECKSSKSRKRVSYQKDINEFLGLSSGLISAAQKLVGGKPKVAFIFATNQAVLGDQDRKRLKGNVHHFTQDDISYFEQLAESLGAAAKHQLFGRLFEGVTIPELENRVPAVRGKMSGKHVFYSFSIAPEYLLKTGFILHRTESTSDTIRAYQRLVKKSRLKGIGSFIDRGGFFPNAIIINIHTESQSALRFETGGGAEHDSCSQAGVLFLPKTYRSAFIIDGQHRLLGYAMASSQQGHTIPVVAFHNLPAEEQSKLFVDINHEQKSVPANLLHSLMADFYWDAKDEKLALSALKTRLLTEMNGDDRSPLYKRLVVAEEKKTPQRCLTLQTLKSWGLPLKVGFFGTFKGNRRVRTGYLTESTNEKTLEKARKFFDICLSRFETELADQWERGSNEGGFIAMNVGVSAIFRVLDNILDHIERVNGAKCELLDGKELASRAAPYLEPVIVYVKGLDAEARQALRAQLGSGATEKVLREFQAAIHEAHEDFSPEGLSEWNATKSGKFNDTAYELGHKKIEPKIHEIVKRELQVRFGLNSWWQDGVTIDIQKNCALRQIDDQSKEPPENFLLTVEYLTIIKQKQNWSFLGNLFSPPGTESDSKVKRLSWIEKFNRIRKKYSHPQRSHICEEELIFLQSIWEWLKAR